MMTLLPRIQEPDNNNAFKSSYTLSGAGLINLTRPRVVPYTRVTKCLGRERKIPPLTNTRRTERVSTETSLANLLATLHFKPTDN